MTTTEMKLSEIRANPNNPRLIKDEKFAKLVESIRTFPEMLKLRPIVINDDNIVLGGNMRLKACKEAGLKTVPVIKASELTEEQQREFIIKDNVGFGDWDWTMLANEWDDQQLQSWAVDVWVPPAEVDYSILEGSNVDSELDDMAKGVKKAIQIEFETEHYEEAFALVKFWRDQKLYIGGFLMEKLREEKEKL